MMDFSKFRKSGDLSDITVTVGHTEHNLHKFPLYAKSDYFCELARSQPGGDAEPFKADLKDFPGGDDTFGQVANFCYNMPVNLTKNNIIAMRCAAEYLKMFGPGNLKDVANKFLMETLTSAKTNRFTSIIMSMLMDCNEIGDIAEAAGIVDACIEAFVGCWVKSVSKYSTHGRGGRTVYKIPQRSEASSAFTRVDTPSSDKIDEASVKSLLSLRVDWFAMLLTKAGIKGVSYAELGRIAVRYISSALEGERASKGELSSVVESSMRDNDNDETSVVDDDKDIDTNNSASDHELSATVDIDTKRVTRLDTPTRAANLKKFDIGTVLDRVITLLPDQAFSIPAVTLEWLTSTIREATLHDCECRGKLIRLAGEMLAKLDPKDLCFISPSVLHDIVVDASDEKHGPTSRMSTDRACSLVDKYLVQMVKEGTLTAEAFRLLASATKGYKRTTHDRLYSGLEFVMKSEKDKLTPEQRTELTDFVNFDLLSEPSLQKALEEEMVPASKIANSAIKLCTALRTELSSVKYNADMQEGDFQTYRTSVKTTPTNKSSSASEFVEQDDSLDKSSLETTARNADADFSDHYPSPDPLKSARHVLSTARQKLNLPVYTGYRPAILSRLSPPIYGGHVYLHKYHSPRENDIGLDEELEFQLDRSFQSLDPRIRFHSLTGHQHHTVTENGNGAYFPYSSHSHRF